MIQEVGRDDQCCRALLVWMEYIIISRDRDIRKSGLNEGENRIAAGILLDTPDLGSVI